MKMIHLVNLSLILACVMASGCDSIQSKWVADVTEADLPRLEAKMKELGVPVRSAEFQAFIAVPSGQNGDVQFAKAIKLQKSLEKKIDAIEKKTGAFRKSGYRGDLNISQTDFTAMQPLFDIYAQVAKRPYCIPKYDSSLGFGDEFEGLSESRQFVKLASFFALQSASNHRLDRATYYFNAAADRSNQVADTPTFVHYMVQAATHAVLIKTVQQAMSLDPRHSAQYANLLKNLKPESFGRTVQGDLGSGIIAARVQQSSSWDKIESLKKLDPEDPALFTGKTYSKPTEGNPVDRRGRIVLAQLMHDCLPILETIDKSGKIIDLNKFEKFKSNLLNYSPEGKRSRLFSAIILPVLASVPNYEQQIETQKTLADLLSKVIQYKLKNGRYPSDILGYKENKDPIETFKKRLIAEGIATETSLTDLEKEIKVIVGDAAQFAQDSPEPPESELYTDVLV